MILKPQDLLVLLKLVTLGGARWSYNGLATDLGMSPSEVHAAMTRAVAARLAVSKGDVVAPVLTALTEFLAHGGQYAFVPDRGALTRGMPTAHAALPLRNELAQSSDPSPVWPDPEGEVRGLAFSPPVHGGSQGGTQGSETLRASGPHGRRARGRYPRTDRGLATPREAAAGVRCGRLNRI